MNIGAILKRLEAPPLVGGYSWISTAPKALYLWKVWREVSKKLMSMWKSKTVLELPSWKFNSSPLKILPSKKERLVFQPIIFQGRAVKPRGCTLLETNILLVKDPFESMMVFLFHRWDMLDIKKGKCFLLLFSKATAIGLNSTLTFFFGDDLFFSGGRGFRF